MFTPRLKERSPQVIDNRIGEEVKGIEQLPVICVLLFGQSPSAGKSLGVAEWPALKYKLS